MNGPSPHLGRRKRERYKVFKVPPKNIFGGEKGDHKHVWPLLARGRRGFAIKKSERGTSTADSLRKRGGGNTSPI